MLERIFDKIRKISFRIFKRTAAFLFGLFGLDEITGLKINPGERKMEKLGTDYGGWTVPTESLGANSICYTVGAGEDVSFDCLLAEKFGAEVFIFDPTPRAIAHFEKLLKSVQMGEKMNINNNPLLFYEISEKNLTKLHYLRYGVWKEDGVQKFYAPKKKEWVSHAIVNSQKTTEYFEAECRKVSSAMKELGHAALDLLKLDVEGAEYEVIKSMLGDGVRPRILCVEFDEINFESFESFFKIRRTARELAENGYRLVYTGGGDYTFFKK